MSQYINTEKDIRPIIDDFEVFCQFIEDNRPKLGKARGELGKKDCFTLNALLSRPKTKNGPHYLQPTYPTINLLFYISIASGLFAIAMNEMSSAVFLSSTTVLEKYRSLNPFTKYMFLFRAYWTLVDYNRLYGDSMHSYSNPIGNVRLAMEVLQNIRPGEKVPMDFASYIDGRNTRAGLVCALFLDMGPAADHLADFGLWKYEESVIPELSKWRSGASITEVTPTPLGSAMIRACLDRRIELYHERLDEDSIFRCCNDTDLAIRTLANRQKAKYPKRRERFEKVFELFFPAGSIDSKAIEALLQDGRESAPVRKGNVYVFKVIFSGRVWRRFKLSSHHTMHELHLAIQDTYSGFAGDHMYAFFMDGKAWSQKAVWDPRAEDYPKADEAVVGRLGLMRGQRILYLYDFGDENRLDVRVDEILQEDAPPLRPVVVDKKGELPEPHSYWGG
ncbi:MAG TPA: hypothetical protein VMW83_12670 [Spirochaetia bacterium]|nr:hypothetical protein [Spirochaetia bacterium]